MKKILAALMLLPLLAFISACSTHHQATTASGKTVYGEQAQIIERLNNAGNNLQQLMNAPDNRIPSDVLRDAKCVAVVPDMVKGGFVIGGNHGRGVGTCRTGDGWSQPAFFVVTGGSWGAQIGLESVDLVMVFMDPNGLNQLLTSQVKLGAEGGLAAGPVGREAQASTDWKMKNKILVYSRTKGLFAGLDLSGASVKPDEDSTQAFYKKDVPPQTILSGQGPKNPNADNFLAQVRQAFSESRASAQ